MPPKNQKEPHEKQLWHEFFAMKFDSVFLKNELIAQGADLVGYADLSHVLAAQSYGFRYGISIAVALNRDIIKTITDGPTPVYFEEYKRVNMLLNQLNALTVSYLEAAGFRA